NRVLGEGQYGSVGPDAAAAAEFSSAGGSGHHVAGDDGVVDGHGYGHAIFVIRGEAAAHHHVVLSPLDSAGGHGVVEERHTVEGHRDADAPRGGVQAAARRGEIAFVGRAA